MLELEIHFVVSGAGVVVGMSNIGPIMHVGARNFHFVVSGREGE